MLDDLKTYMYVPGEEVVEDACFRIEYGPKSYRVGNFGHVGFISGESGSKKSTYAKSICASALSGRKIVFNKVNIGRKKVLYFDTEMPRDLFVSHIDRMFKMAKMVPQEAAERFIGVNMVEQTDPEVKREIVMNMIHKFRDDLGIVVIDVIADLFIDENDTEKAQAFVGEIAGMAMDIGFMGLIVSHLSDAGKLLGTVGRKLGRKSSFGMRLEEVDDITSTVNPGKTRYERYPSFDFYLDRDGIPMPGEYIPFPVSKQKQWN